MINSYILFINNYKENNAFLGRTLVTLGFESLRRAQHHIFKASLVSSSPASSPFISLIVFFSIVFSSPMFFLAPPFPCLKQKKKQHYQEGMTCYPNLYLLQVVIHQNVREMALGSLPVTNSGVTIQLSHDSVQDSGLTV